MLLFDCFHKIQGNEIYTPRLSQHSVEHMVPGRCCKMRCFLGPPWSDRTKCKVPIFQCSTSIFRCSTSIFRCSTSIF